MSISYEFKKEKSFWRRPPIIEVWFSSLIHKIGFCLFLLPNRFHGGFAGFPSDLYSIKSNSVNSFLF
jgi:hypothetical protein